MISYLKGQIKNKNQRSLTLDINNIGYEIFLPLSFLERLKIGEVKEFFCHLHVRQDVMELYGFETIEEKNFFELLITISGVGPKSALQVLTIAKINEIKKAIVHGDPTLLRKVSGIGQKTADRIIVELKDKLENLALSEQDIKSINDDHGVFEALQGLGYSEREVREVMRRISTNLTDENETIKQALKMLGKR